MSWASRLSFYSLRRTMEWWHDGEIIKSLRHFRFACLIGFCMSLRQHPCSISWGQCCLHGWSKPLRKASPLCTARGIPSRSEVPSAPPLLPGRVPRTSQSSGFMRHLTHRHGWSMGCPGSWAVRRAGSGICAHGLEDEDKPALAHVLPAPFQPALRATVNGALMGRGISTPF